MPRTHFLSKQTILFLYGNFIENSESLSSVIFKNSPAHKTTLPNAIMGFIKIFITSVNPSHYNINDLKSLIHLVVHNNHPQKIEFKTVNYQDIKQFNNSFEVNHIDLNEDPILNNTVRKTQQSQK